MRVLAKTGEHLTDIADSKNCFSPCLYGHGIARKNRPNTRIEHTGFGRRHNYSTSGEQTRTREEFIRYSK